MFDKFRQSWFFDIASMIKLNYKFNLDVRHARYFSNVQRVVGDVRNQHSATHTKHAKTEVWHFE